MSQSQIFKQLQEVSWKINTNEFSFVLSNSALEAQKLIDELHATQIEASDIYYFPTWETLPYDRYSPGAVITAQRLDTLYRMRTASYGVIVTSIDAVMSKLCPPSYLDAHALIIKLGDEIPMTTLNYRLSQAGYSKVDKVVEKGQYSHRGAVIDLFPPSAKFPIRLEYLDDEIEQIRVFDVKTQLSVTKINQVYIIPSREVDLSDSGITCFRQSLRQEMGDEANYHPIYQKLSEHKMASGLECFLPLFFDETNSFFDYLPKKKITTYVAFGAKAYLKKQHQYIRQRYLSVSAHSKTYLPPAHIYFSEKTLLSQIDKLTEESVSQRVSNISENTISVKPIKLHERTKEGVVKNLLKLAKQLKSSQQSCYIFCKTQGEKNLFLDKLKESHAEYVESIEFFKWKQQQKAQFTAGIGIGLWHQSVEIIKNNSASHIYCARDFLFQVGGVDTEEQSVNPLQIIDDLSQIEIGTPVVHKDHGVGRYHGLEVVTIDDDSSEYIVIKYAQEGKLYIPVTSLDLIERYTGTSPEKAPLHSLDGSQWKKAKEKAQKKIYDTAAELLEIYAKRAKATGQAIEIDDAKLAKFAEKFPFKPTTDQKKVFKSVYNDLIKDKPMDRIVCGDVGFGKTEVALRAAFVMAMSGKQVALLVPTTLLAEQHLKHFQERFADFSIVVDGLSRFKTVKEQKAVLSQLAEGKVDIIIGTHRIIQKDVDFSNLGLVIIDEEHKFGVKQKEVMKQLRSDINILTLTATPIPRTLSMSLSGLRDLSIIASPPGNRSPVETIFTGFDENVIKEGVTREIARGGQIYFLHNVIDTMNNMETQLKQWFPELKIQHAHGQMPENQLENIMKRFYEQHFDILLTTTIIESGIDNPNANTIFINRADKFGLAQLHQLRGRVGRSTHQAYAYLISPPESIISADAVKRLSAFESLKGLGVGFMLASQDMEIRGAGEILGGNQSGQIIEIGFSLFNRLLEETVDAMKNNREINYDQSHSDIEIDLGISALIPEDYIFDVHSRLTLYKRIASCSTDEQIDQLYIECVDRFGLIPEPMNVLFVVFRLRLKAKKIGMTKVLSDEQSIRLSLANNHKVDGEKLIGLIQKNPMKYQLKGQFQLKINKKLPDWQVRAKYIDGLFGDFV